MESTEQLKIDERQEAISHWLQSLSFLSRFTLQQMPQDASFRRYYRLYTESGSYVVMDAPPPENCHQFQVIADALRHHGLNAPEIFAANKEAGWMVMSDFGEFTYLNSINAKNANLLYGVALDALAVLQSCRDVGDITIPNFSAKFMWQEWEWHKEWFLRKLLNLTDIAEEKELDHCFLQLTQSALDQPQVFMHRDYHSGNLMILPHHQVGILDFQDAFMGPVTYDAVSLLRDCYLSWDEGQVQKWALWYWQKLHALSIVRDDEQTFLRWFDLMGVERHLKALFTFSRKQVRDNQSQYLQHIPRTLQYLISVTKKYPELAVLHHFLLGTVQSAWIHYMAQHHSQRNRLCEG